MSKILERWTRAKRTPRNEWTIEDVATVCRNFGLDCRPPRIGSHFVVSHPDIEGLLTVPANRSIKPIYYMLLIQLIETLERRR